MKHEDDRRVLISYPYKEGEIKLIITKEDCVLGDHYHKVKTEEFRLLKGFGQARIDGHEFVLLPDQPPFRVLPGMSHSFMLRKDSVLTCIVSHPYDKNDDYEE